jgi:(p)ppGpp synthase/HD superfamily hydrolase
MEATFALVPLKDMDPAALGMAVLAEASRVPGMNERTVANAIAAASYLHLNQTRANRGSFARTAYIEHPLRGALRALRWGVTDEQIVTGILLHDTVEDCLPRLLDAFAPGRRDHLSVEDQRDRAYAWIGDQFGPAAAALVLSLTNPVPGPVQLSKAQKREQYAAHVAEAIGGDAAAFIGKFTDFMDNAGGLHHNLVPGQEGMVGHLALKYGPVVDIFRRELETNHGNIMALVSQHGFDEITAKLGALKGRLSALETANAA